MAKPHKPVQLSAELESQFHYDGTGDIYRPLRLLRDRYVERAAKLKDSHPAVSTRYLHQSLDIQHLIPTQAQLLAAFVAAE